MMIRSHTLPDADMQACSASVATRAAQRAREIAERTGTKLVVRDDADPVAEWSAGVLAGWPGGVSPPPPGAGAVSAPLP
jgi:broad specificity phosphatase PhoE